MPKSLRLNDLVTLSSTDTVRVVSCGHKRTSTRTGGVRDRAAPSIAAFNASAKVASASAYARKIVARFGIEH
jgi:hypothetical protein